MKEKIIGYGFLFLGTCIMALCAINMFMVLTNRVKPFPYFNLSSDKDASLNLSSIVGQMKIDNKDVLNSGIALPKINIIPYETLNQILNISNQFLLLTFVMGFGYKLASLGVQLIRPINVKLKSTSSETVIENDKPEIKNV
jgi:hypothetical protein